MSPLPALPRIALRVHEDHSATAKATGGFLNLRRVVLVASYPDGRESKPFPYDLVTRRALDAVVMIAHVKVNGQRHVYLRSAVRPPCALRPLAPAHDGGLWELPAGLIDDGETEAEAAARELDEELGFQVPPSALAPLGPWTFPTPGVIAERHIYFHVEVDPKTQRVPSEDGSALERGAAILLLPLDEALEHCRRGDVHDAKTELALRRLAEIP
ncbi:MAG: NUDIX domain-containing protein [Myxococcales bacterium]